MITAAKDPVTMFINHADYSRNHKFTHVQWQNLKNPEVLVCTLVDSPYKDVKLCQSAAKDVH